LSTALRTPARGSKARATAARANTPRGHAAESVTGVGLHKPLGLRASQII